MPSLTQLRKVVPGAESVAGRVVAYHNGKHVDLGQYVGDGMVILSSEGEALMAAEPPKKPARKVAVNENAKPAGGLDLAGIDV